MSVMRVCCFLLVLVSFLGKEAKARELNFLFKKISIEEGLPHSCVYDIQQDSLGFIWFGTHDGVARFDGDEFMVFDGTQELKGNLLSREIRSIMVDAQGDIWFAGDKGVSKYVQKQGQIQNFPFFNGIYGYNLIKIGTSSNGEIFTVSRDGDLYKYAPLLKDFIEIKLPSNKGEINKISSMTIQNSLLLLGTNIGLVVFDPQQNDIEVIQIPNMDSSVNQVLWMDDGSWIVATELDGLFFLDGNFKVKEHWVATPTKNTKLLSNTVRSLRVDKNRNLWIGTFLGLTVFNLDSYQLKTMQQEFERPYSLSQNSIRSIYEDKEGGIWLGTFFGGVNYYHSTKIKFDLINHNGGSLSLSGNVVASLMEDHKGRIWVGTNDNGINIINPERTRIKSVKKGQKGKVTLSSNNIKSMIELPNKKILVGTHEKGLNLLARSGEVLKVFQHSGDTTSLPDDHVYALLKDHKNQIWVGTWEGVAKWNPENETFHLLKEDTLGNELPNRKVTFLYEDRKNRIWIGTVDGVTIFYPEANRFDSFVISLDHSNHLPSGMINTIMEDHRGQLWIGTARGVVIFDEINRTFVAPKGLEVLKDRLICSIEEDAYGALWISYNGGLVSYNTSEFKANVYLVEDGLQGKQFSVHSSLKSRDSHLYFGGINGITVFDPMTIKEQPFEGKVILNGLEVNQVMQVAGAENSVLSNSLQFTPSIDLKPTQRNFSFSYGIIDYIQSRHIKYRYRLSGFGDNNWIDANQNKKAIFSNIPYGEYLFEVQAIDLYTERQGAIARVKVVIHKPWYLTTLAWIGYFILSVLFFWTIYRVIIDKVRMRNSLYRERVEKQNIEEVNRHKLEFFTNISHEFRTPLTLILSPIERLLDRNDFDFEVQRQVVTIHKNAKRLLRLVNQVMEFRKAEMGEVHLYVSNHNISVILQEVFNAFIGRAKKQNISYIFDEPDQEVHGYIDPIALEKVLFNLLSNAFRYHKTGSKIILRVRVEKENLILTVEDDGVGIPPESIGHIFDRYYRVNEKETGGTGIGLAYVHRLVTLHKGTIEASPVEPTGVQFKVTLPIASSSYDSVVIDQEIKEMSLSSSEKELWAEDAAEDHTLEVTTSKEEEGEHKPHIMVVDDNIEIGNYLVQELSSAYKVTYVSQGEHALKVVLDKMPDVIISDVMMPEVDGVTLCKRIKQNICTCHIPVIMITAKATLEDQLIGLRNGADDYIEKPFSIKILRAKIENFIKMQNRMKKIFKNEEDIEVETLAFNRMDEEFLVKAREIVENSLCDATFTVDRFAKEIGMSRSNLHLKMKAILGSTASDYIKKIRFNKAIQLLEEQKYTVAEVSYMVGFNTPSYFSTSFKKFFGYLPTEHTPQKRRESVGS